jgi:hypothetical protein
MSEDSEKKPKIGLFRQVVLLLDYFRKKDRYLKEFAIGMNSDVDIKKDLHILFLDFDDVSIGEVEESISEIQEFWNLSDCFIYRTKNGFHAFFYYDIMPYSRVKMIMDYAKYVDPMFKYISKYYDYKTIRVAGKYKIKDISFVKVLHGKRIPNLRESEIGNLKRKERELLSNCGSMLNKGALK